MKRCRAEPSLSIGLFPRSQGLTPWLVRFQRRESAVVPSLTTDGLRYRHPAGEQQAVVWATTQAGIDEVLTYHYQDTWHSAAVIPEQEGL